MTMKSAKLISGLATLGVLLIGSSNSAQAAGSAPANLAVSASINSNCTISTNAVGFPAYDPIVTHASAPDDSTSGSVVITCTKGAATTIGLGLGANASGTQMRMTDGSSNYLEYALYSNTGRSTVWGNAAPNLVTPAVAPDKNARTFTVYGRIPAAQDLPAGTYTDTVVATVNF
jgi:spore coat protein U-like protein